MSTVSIESPPAITAEITAGIVQRHSDHMASFTEPAWAARSEAFGRLMAPMSNDKRVQYLSTVGCDDDAIRRITRAAEESFGKAGKAALRVAARSCVAANKDIGILLGRWPESEHFRLLSEKLAGLSDEQISLANAYAACQIYEAAATAFYLAIVDGLAPVATEEPSDLDTLARDRAMADAGYTDEVARWPK